jgi:hypothetical protein
MMTRLLVLALLAGCSEYSVFTDTREEFLFETFVVEGVKTDIIFYADTSHSMERELITLGDSVRNFVDRLDATQNAWQIIAVTGPDGCGHGGILNPQTENFQDLFAEGITTEPAEDNVDEWGLFNVFKAALETTPGGCNEGFLRQDASLHVIFLTDEDDNSPGFEREGYWQDYVNPVLYLKDDPQLVRFSAIAGPVPNGCEGADPGYGYSDAVTATQGEFISICSSWDSQVELLADASIQQAFFPLQHKAASEELFDVEVNEETRETGWFYDADRQGIEFTEAIPGAYDKVDIWYQALVEFEVEEKL